MAIKIRDIVIIEYQDGMENWDIPYFEGMQSVKMPVLKSIGKNLLNHHVCNTRLGAVVKNITNNSITFTAPQPWAGLSWVCFLEPNQEYTVSFKTDLTIAQLKGYVRFPNTNQNATGGSHKFSFRTDSTGKIQFTIESTTASEADITVSDVQIEKGSAATPYEPYKSNILTVNEDVTLRSDGNICDELNLLTGQLTQRIGEDGVVLSQEVVKTVDLSDNYVYSYKDVTHYNCSSEEGSLVPTLSIDVPTNLPAVVARQRATIQELEKENVALKNEIEETANSSVNGDLELMSSQFELYFRLFEIEMNLDMPMMATMRGVKSMAMTVYQQAKILILAGKYEREDMEYKLNRYKAAGRITVEEYEELIALMDAQELVK